jgi:hypothetical protein
VTSRRSARLALAGAFAAGAALSLLLVVRGQVGADQINLLARGWLLVAEERFVPYGNPTSAGGFEAGGASTVLVALPLYLWRDARAPVLLIVAAQALGYWLLDRVLRRTAGRAERLVFAIVYWLSPWRLYHSGFLWNPNYLFLAGAVHASTLLAQRARARAWPSFLHVVTIGLAMQLHPSSVWMPIATALLWIRGYARIHVPGAIVGAGAIVLSLVPWVAAVVRDPSLLPGGEGFPLRGLIFVFPLVRGVFLWLRYGSLWVSEKFVRFDFSQALAPQASAIAEALVRALYFVAAPATLACSAFASFRLLRRPRSILGPRHRRDGSGRAWIRGYARLGFLSGLAAFALSPTTVMSWQGLVLFHAAVLPVALWGGALARTRRRGAVRTIALAWAAASVLLAVALAFGSSRYRCESLTIEVPPLRHDHRMFHELGIHDRCPLVTDDPDGWWTDLLSEQ